MAWYYHQNGTNQGPLQISDLQGLVGSRAISADTLVWTEGMAAWLPYHSSPAVPTSVSGAPAAITHVCAECHKSFREEDMLQYDNSWVCAACKPIFFQRVKEGVVSVGQLNYARIGSRFAAVFVDGIMIGIVCVILLWPLYAAIFSTFSHITPGHPPTLPKFSVGFRLYQYTVSYGLPAAYEIFFIGAYGATLGKMLMKVKVVMPDGGRVSYARATGRHFAKILSGIILYIGYLMAFWDDEKRALHDRICATRVIVNDGP
jgi:uncharacterized RDD family membrane protein YckC